jgi:hypothetical protein
MGDIPCQWTREGFIMRWFDRVKEGKTYELSYSETEEEHILIFSHRRYKNWEAFKNSYYSAMKNRKSNNL